MTVCYRLRKTIIGVSATEENSHGPSEMGWNSIEQLMRIKIATDPQ